jgi:hypothetical protein
MFRRFPPSTPSMWCVLVVLVCVALALPIHRIDAAVIDWSASNTIIGQVPRICTLVGASSVATTTTAAAAPTTTAATTTTVTTATSTTSAANVTTAAPIVYTNTVVCYRNIFGNFYFVCDQTEAIVRLFRCSDSACSADCVIVQNFTARTPVQSVFDGSKNYNWTGDFYSTNAGYATQFYYDRDRIDGTCNSSTVAYVNHVPNSATACLPWATYTKASMQWRCSAGNTLVTNTQYLLSGNCTVTGDPQYETTVIIANASACLDGGASSWACGNPNLAINVVVFGRFSGAGGAGAVDLVVTMISLCALLILMLI